MQTRLSFSGTAHQAIVCAAHILADRDSCGDGPAHVRVPCSARGTLRYHSKKKVMQSKAAAALQSSARSIQASADGGLTRPLTA